MIREILRFIWDVIKAIFKLKSSLSHPPPTNSEVQQNLQNQYDKIDEQHQVNPNPSLQEIENKLNDRF